MFSTFSFIEQTKFHEALHFLHVEELRTLCERLNLPLTGKKGDLIQRIFHFLQTGEITKIPIVPKASCAQSGMIYQLHPTSPILKGAYKNDLKTRLFFKQLIGDHFHFTAFGIDWINERWLDGNPPTYQEFATMWQEQYKERKSLGTTPKAEWRYIRFTQSYVQEHPTASRSMIINAWTLEREKQRKLVNEIIKSYTNKRDSN